MAGPILPLSFQSRRSSDPIDDGYFYPEEEDTQVAGVQQEAERSDPNSRQVVIQNAAQAAQRRNELLRKYEELNSEQTVRARMADLIEQQRRQPNFNERDLAQALPSMESQVRTSVAKDAREVLGAIAQLDTLATRWAKAGIGNENKPMSAYQMQMLDIRTNNEDPNRYGSAAWARTQSAVHQNALRNQQVAEHEATKDYRNKSLQLRQAELDSRDYFNSLRARGMSEIEAARYTNARLTDFRTQFNIALKEYKDTVQAPYEHYRTILNSQYGHEINAWGKELDFTRGVYNRQMQSATSQRNNDQDNAQKAFGQMLTLYKGLAENFATEDQARHMLSTIAKYYRKKGLPVPEGYEAPSAASGPGRSSGGIVAAGSQGSDSFSFSGQGVGPSEDWQMPEPARRSGDMPLMRMSLPSNPLEFGMQGAEAWMEFASQQPHVGPRQPMTPDMAPRPVAPQFELYSPYGPRYQAPSVRPPDTSYEGRRQLTDQIAQDRNEAVFTGRQVIPMGVEAQPMPLSADEQAYLNESSDLPGYVYHGGDVAPSPGMSEYEYEEWLEEQRRREEEDY